LLEFLARKIQQLKERRDSIGKKEFKLFWFGSDDPMLKNPKDSTKNLLDLIINFGNVEGYVISIQTSVAFLSTNDQ
jgi:hypothetical protein